MNKLIEELKRAEQSKMKHFMVCAPTWAADGLEIQAENTFLAAEQFNQLRLEATDCYGNLELLVLTGETDAIRAAFSLTSNWTLNEVQA